ncbi:MAG: hypothetical protein CM15mP77_2790 [Synechococcus sp.]|nr:MAG: hypothetical protein CM15mP77_2790 [Synechococcus sp.]
MALIVKHCENIAIAGPIFPVGLLPTALAVGGKAACANAIGSKATMTSPVPDELKADRPMSRTGRKGTRLRLSPNATLRSTASAHRPLEQTRR